MQRAQRGGRRRVEGQGERSSLKTKERGCLRKGNRGKTALEREERKVIGCRKKVDEEKYKSYKRGEQRRERRKSRNKVRAWRWSEGIGAKEVGPKR